MSKHQLKVWLEGSDAVPKLPRSTAPNGKVMLSVWWDCQRILLAKFYSKDQIMKADDYTQQLRELREILKKDRREMLTRIPLILQDNAPIHKAKVSMAAASDYDYQLVDHLLYSPDLAPSDYWLFPWLKSQMYSHCFKSDSEVEAAIN